MAKRRIPGFLSSLSERLSGSAAARRAAEEEAARRAAEEEAARRAAEQVEPESDRRPADAALAELKGRATAEPTALDQRGEVASVDQRVEVAAAAQRAGAARADQREIEAVLPLRAAVPVDEDGELVMPPLVIPEPLPAGLNLRRYALGIGIGLALATLAAWLLLGG